MVDLNSLLLAGFCFLVGAGLVGMVMYFRNASQTRQKTPAASPPDPELAEVGRLWRNRRTGALAVEMDGRVYHSSGELSNGQQHILTIAVGVLQKWLGKPVEAASGQALPIIGAGAEQPAVAQPVKSVTTQQPSTEVKPVSVKPLDALGRMLGPSKPAPQFKSITAQINDILQEKLAGTALEGKGITLAETPDRGVLVRVGLDQYAGVDSVPDEEIRKVIKLAVAEWERQSRTGIR